MEAQDAVRTSVSTPLAHKLRVRYGECDPQGVVFNAHFLAYFDIGITELIRAAFGSYQAMVERGVDFVVAEAGLRFHRPAHFDDELTVETAVTQLGTTSMTTSYRIVRDGELLVDGTLRHVLVDLQRLVEREPSAKTTIPDWMRAGLAPYLALEPPVPASTDGDAGPAALELTRARTKSPAMSGIRPKPSVPTPPGSHRGGCG